MGFIPPEYNGVQAMTGGKSMDPTSKASNWQGLLAELITNLSERERLAQALSVRPVTLIRWAKNISRPQERNLRKLLQVLPPSLAPTFGRLVAVEFPGLMLPELPGQQEPVGLPSAFYEQILRAYAKLPAMLSRQTLWDLFLQQAIEHLDPQRQGMAIHLAVCVRPLEGQVVRSLRDMGGIGTSPWRRDLEQKTMLLGAESLVGYALFHFRRVVVPNRSDITMVPIQWAEHEQSAIAIPIARHAQVCGCLLATSAVPDFFGEGEEAALLLEHYAMLAPLLFDERDFYALSAIQLHLLPSYEVQRPYFQQVARRVQQRFRLAQVRGELCTLEQARHQVWREIEEELIQAFLNTSAKP